MASTPNTPRWAPYDDLTGWLRGLGITLAAAGFLAFAGAFRSERAPWPARFTYWFGLMVLGWLWGMVVSNVVFSRIGRPRSIWLRVAATALVLSIPYSAVVGLASVLAFHSNFSRPADIAALFGAVFAVSAVMIALNVLVDRHTRGATSASSMPAKFLDRLPLKLRGAEIWAVEAEDHYLRLHTSKGQDLILMRLSDAVAELEGIEGAQTHRSWWVARDGVTEAARGDGRATLTLKDGVQAPVSRTHARLLRERGWF